MSVNAEACYVPDVNINACPFCGGEPLIMTSTDGFTSIGCDTCNPLFIVMLQGQFDEVVGKWNKTKEAGE